MTGPRKPSQDRRPRALGWVDLPASGRKGRTPPLPSLPGFTWSPEARRLWKDTWRTPQATQFEPSGRTLWRWIRLMADWIDDPRSMTAALMTEMRRLEAEHGLAGPRSLTMLRWRIVDDDELRTGTQLSPAGQSSASSAEASAEAATGTAVLHLLRPPGA